MITVLRRIRWQQLLLASAVATLAACSSSPASPSAPGSPSPLSPEEHGAKYKLSEGDVSDWKPASGSKSFEVFSASTLTGKINGGAPVYTDRGCVSAMYQEIMGADDRTGELVVMDFKTDANATTMFQYQKEHFALDIPIANRDESTAMGTSVLGGVKAYAHFKASYFEVTAGGYGDDATAAAGATAELLTELESRTK